MDAADTVALLMSPQGRIDPYPAYAAAARLRAGGPGRPGDVRVTGYAEADQLLRDPPLRALDDALRDRFLPGWRDSAAIASISRSMLRTNPPDHSRMRRLAAGGLHPAPDRRDARRAWRPRPTS